MSTRWELWNRILGKRFKQQAFDFPWTTRDTVNQHLIPDHWKNRRVMYHQLQGLDLISPYRWGAAWNLIYWFYPVNCPSYLFILSPGFILHLSNLLIRRPIVFLPSYFYSWVVKILIPWKEPTLAYIYLRVFSLLIIHGKGPLRKRTLSSLEIRDQD